MHRYALTRWAADPYELLVLHQGGLAESDAGIIAELKRVALEGTEQANIRVHEVDTSAALDDWTAAAVKLAAPPSLPALVLCYPRSSAPARIAWSSALSQAAAGGIITSPARRKLVERLRRGEAVTWILLTSGVAELDTGARERLAPWRETVLEVAHDDPAEEVFRAMLMGSETDLVEHVGQPMAFPAFGRGRILYALVGRGINEMHIRGAGEFLEGPCACEIKEQNPGVDLLMAADWDTAMDLLPMDEEEDGGPLLAGLPPPAIETPTNPADAAGSSTSVAPGEAAEPQPQEGQVAAVGLLVVPIAMLGLAAAVALIVGLVISRRGRG